MGVKTSGHTVDGWVIWKLALLGFIIGVILLAMHSLPVVELVKTAGFHDTAAAFERHPHLLVLLDELSRDLGISLIIFALLSITLEAAASRHVESQVSDGVNRIQNATVDTLFAAVYGADVHRAIKPLATRKFSRTDARLHLAITRDLTGQLPHVALVFNFAYCIRNMTRERQLCEFGISDELCHDPSFPSPQLSIDEATWDDVPLDIKSCNRTEIGSNWKVKYTWAQWLDPGEEKVASLQWTTYRHSGDHYDLAMSYITENLDIEVTTPPDFEVSIGPLGDQEENYKRRNDRGSNCTHCPLESTLIHGQGITIWWRSVASKKQLAALSNLPIDRSETVHLSPATKTPAADAGAQRDDSP